MSRYDLLPDGVFDLDSGAGSSAAGKVAEVVDPEVFADRAEDRGGYRELDAALEMMPGMTRRGRDSARAEPLGRVDGLRHPAMRRRLLGDGELRRPLSSRQRKDRSKLKRDTQQNLPMTQYRAVAGLIGDEQNWDQLCDALSEKAGDAQHLSPADKIEVDRIDRAIQRYEEGNQRGHVVFANVRLPAEVLGARNPEKWVTEHLPGGEITFDRYSTASHSLHEIDDSKQSAWAVEIETRRGMYLGHSDSLDDTRHLLPRGLRLRVRGWSHAPYERPDGSTGYRRTLQLIDADTPTPKESHHGN